MNKLFEQLLEVRGFAPSFLQPRYEETVDAQLLPDVAVAVQRILQAKDRGERVLIYGDYDVDGVTASTVMYDALRLAGVKQVEVMLPNRFTDGYGMSKKVIQRCQDEQIGLVVTVDCGSQNHAVIAELAEVGVEVIVTDHHECAEELPAALAVVNPKRPDLLAQAQKVRGRELTEEEILALAELRELAGVGVAFKVAQALVQAGAIPAGQEKWLLDLVLMGTICDSMQLTGENRRLCFYGFKVLEKTRRPGLKELLRAAKVKNLNSEAIGFIIGPRLNAAGRMKTAEKALALLMTEKKTEAAKLAEELEKLNAERRQAQQAAVTEIAAQGVGELPVIVVQGSWHEGVLGIIAGRLVEEYQRPTFVLSEVEGCLKGSGRSFGEFNLAKALMACKEQIIGGGGHAEACGLKIPLDGLAEFRQAVNDYYESLELVDQERFLGVSEDLVVEDLADFSLELADGLLELEPYGAGNAEPVFLLPEMRVLEVTRLGADGKHLRLTVRDDRGGQLKLMSFYAPDEYFAVSGGELVNVWMTLSVNEFRGLKSVEGKIVKLESC